MRRLLSVASLILIATVAPASAQVGKTMEKAAAAPKPKADDANPVVVLDTSMGPITIQLDRAKAPVTVENFLKYVDEGYYDGLIFHRIIPGFMIQGGGMQSSGGRMVEKNATYPAIKNESKGGMSNARGTIAMARQDSPNSATCQFFINHGNNKNLDTYRGGYTAFGKVIDGMDVVDAIAKTKTDMSEGEGGVPEKPPIIKSAKRKA